MKQVTRAAWIIAALCVGIRLGADLLAPVLPMLIAFVFVASIIFWAVGRR